MPEPIKVLLASPEVAPLAQTGGLAEMVASLPKALYSLGVSPMVIIPGYRDALKYPGLKVVGSFKVPMANEITPFELLVGELAPGVPVYLTRCDRYFDRPGLYGAGREVFLDNPERFAFFCKAILACLPSLTKYPDIILANDWHTGLLTPYLLEMGPQAPQGIFVIHNQGYLGLAPMGAKTFIDLPESYYGLDGLEYYGQLSFLKAGLVFAREVVTVSPSYAREIQTPEGGNGLDGVLRFHSAKLRGVLNGVDYEVWNPATDPYIAANYDADHMEGKKKCKQALKKELSLQSPDDAPLFGLVTRLAAQKGLTLIVESAAELFRLGLDLVILGTGDPWHEEQLTALANQYPEQTRLILAYDAPQAHRIIAGSDFTLIPSIYEPCGLAQMYALRYGTIPVVRAIGGLNDTVRDYAGQNPSGAWDNGFKFNQFLPLALFRAARRAVELYGRPADYLAMAQAGMRDDFSWSASAKAYLGLFQSCLAQRAL
ncbi:MAG: glycogen synthase GlgA [Deltaproteobacteria bacterium]|jgi:starch synthase|nr:glycogen synthase GlgA [Deltaproteobacteria bacterium]